MSSTVSSLFRRGKLWKHQGPLSLAKAPTNILSGSEIIENDLEVQFGKRASVRYDDIVEMLVNEDTNPGDGIGGSVFAKYIKEDRGFAPAYRVLNVTFSDSADAIEKVNRVFDRVRHTSAITDKTHMKDDVFRRTFFVEM